MVVSIASHSEGYLAVRFPFDQRVVNAIRKVPGRRWSAGDKAWLVPDKREDGCRLLQALYDTGLFSIPESGDVSPASPIDETLESLERALESRHYSPRTIHAYAQWVRRFLDGRKGRALDFLSAKKI